METLELKNKFDDLAIVAVYIIDLAYGMVKVDVTTNEVDNSLTVKYTSFKQKLKLEAWLSNQFNNEEVKEIINLIDEHFA